ncbi:MAG: hypothetical protein ACLQPN_12030 [Bryobacteraceae bacterium]
MSNRIPPMMIITQGTAPSGTALLARLPLGGLNFAINAMVAPRFRAPEDGEWLARLRVRHNNGEALRS